MADAASPAPPPLVAHRIRGLIFDLDGTLVDSYSAIRAGLNHARDHFGLPALSLDEVRRNVGHGLERLIAQLVGPQIETGVLLFREHYAAVFEESTFALPGVKPALERLRDAGHVMAVASNKPARFSEPILDSLGLRELFVHVDGPDRCGTTKPDPAMLSACLGRMALPREAALYVGDMTLDVETARQAAVPVVLIASGSSSEAELRVTGQAVLGAIGELPGFLDAGAG